MSNIVNFDKYSINQQNAYPGSSDPSETIAWVSPRDISTVAARILTDSIEKHQDSVYEMIGQAMTASQTGEVISKVLDRNVPYVQVEPLERYRLLTEVAHLPHRGAYFLVNLNENGVHTSRGLDILLGRKPETLEEYLTAHKHQFD
jgi:isochorismate synthase EntC